MARALRSPLLVAATVTFAYVLWIAWAHHLGHDWREWAQIGRTYVHRSTTSPAIDADAGAATSPKGYDGQFFLYIARDPSGARPYIDDPSYRYGRIVYPLAARGAALGRQGAIPLALILVNVVAVGVGTWAVAAWLRRRGQSAWFGAVFGLFPGLFFALWRDLSEVLAYALTAVALFVFDAARLRRVAAATALLALAALTRETALLFALVWCGVLLWERRRTPALVLGAGALLPYVVYRFVFLRLWLGSAGIAKDARPEAVPFGGIAHYFPWGGYELQQVYSVLAPGTFCLGLAVYALWKRVRDPAVWALAANALVLVVLLPRAAWQAQAPGRVSTGVVLAFLLALPALARVLPRTRGWLWLPVVAWFAPWFALLPQALASSW